MQFGRVLCIHVLLIYLMAYICFDEDENLDKLWE